MSSSQATAIQVSPRVADAPAVDRWLSVSRTRPPAPVDAFSGAWQGRLAAESVAVIRDWIGQFQPGVHRRASTSL